MVLSLYIVITSVAIVIFIIFIALRKHQLTELRKELLEKREELLNAATSFRSILNAEYYASKSEYSKWHTKYNQLKSLVQDSVKKKIKIGFDEELKELGSFFEKGDSLIKRSNENFIQVELEKYQDFFDIVEVYPLTENQRRAIVTEEKHNLIVAGAGTGKTSALIGKAGYILQKGLAEPNEILLLSFARKVKNELEERVLARLGQKLRIDTFHSLGLNIIAEVEKKKPSLSELSTDPVKLPNTIMKFIQKRQGDKEFLRNLNRYFAFHKTPYKSKFHFTSLGEYFDYLRSHQVRSLNGELVKSLEECEIANFLYLNGVDYLYESNYKIDVASKEYRQYKPDFFLPEFDIYIEHFGVDRNNMTAPFVDRKKYLAEMEWKRRTHQRNNTILIETYSWEKFEGVLLENLEKNLFSAGVEFREVPPEQIFDKLNKMGLIHPFTKLLATFINLFKSTQKTIEELSKLAKTLPDQERCEAFIDIFSKIYGDYSQKLGKEIDFNDMINKAEGYLVAGLHLSPFKYILVDEFQDISLARFRLIKALLVQNPNAKLYCVGDDWQSIYRFTGSDVSIMTDFEQHFYPAELLRLNRTFRFDCKLCDFSTKFILKNPNQIDKQLVSHHEEQPSSPSVTLLWEKTTTEDLVSKILERISSSEETGSQVFVLGRYNHLKPNNLNRLRKAYPKLQIEYLTAHSSKGKEADYVVIIGLNSEKYAFPSQFEDDPVLNLVLAKKELMPNAEERRLFYVAVTRARKHVYLVANEKSPSLFVTEIERGDYEVVVDKRSAEVNLQCPKCKTGAIILRSGMGGEFFSCSNYPYCRFKPPLCPTCQRGFLYESPPNGMRIRYYICTNNRCSKYKPMHSLAAI